MSLENDDIGFSEWCDLWPESEKQRKRMGRNIFEYNPMALYTKTEIDIMLGKPVEEKKGKKKGKKKKGTKY